MCEESRKYGVLWKISPRQCRCWLAKTLVRKKHLEFGCLTNLSLVKNGQLWESWENLPRQRIVGGNLVVLTLTGDSKWLLTFLKEPFEEDKKFEVSLLMSPNFPSSNKGWRSGGMSIGVAIFGRIWRVDFDQSYLLIGGES